MGYNFKTERMRASGLSLLSLLRGANFLKSLDSLFPAEMGDPKLSRERLQF